MAQAMTVFRDSSGKYLRYWASINVQQNDDDKKKSKKPKYESASISVSLSREAEKTFSKLCTTSDSNDEIDYAFVRADDYWLKAVKGKENNFVILFINKMSEVQKKKDSEEDEE